MDPSFYEGLFWFLVILVIGFIVDVLIIIHSSLQVEVDEGYPAHDSCICGDPRAIHPNGGACRGKPCPQGCMAFILAGT